MTGRLVFRVFLSSPGDVQPEREAAERVVRRLSGIYSAHVDLRLERWEPRFYEATKSFQQQIESTADFDLVVAILWKRIGTELPPDLFRRPAGSAFESGTVLEIGARIVGRERAAGGVRIPQDRAGRLQQGALRAGKETERLIGCVVDTHVP